MHRPPSIGKLQARTSRVLAAGLLLSLCACSSGDVLGNIAGAAVGDSRVSDIVRAGVSGVVDTVEQMNTKFSPEQEYYLGRAVAAEAIAHYGLDPDPDHQAYVKLIGQTIVTLSTRLSGTYGGYHFAVLDSDEANGLSAPGGYIFITRGALVRCADEDEVAAILCHELAHVSLKHAERVIREGRTHGAMFAGVVSAAAAATDSGSSNLTSSMADYMKEVARDFGRQQRELGYGSALEFEADLEGTYLLYDTGYDASALSGYMQANTSRTEATWSTHPPAQTRISAMASAVDQYGGGFDGGVGRTARASRFEQIMRQGMPVDTVVQSTGDLAPTPPTGPGMPPPPPPPQESPEEPDHPPSGG